MKLDNTHLLEQCQEIDFDDPPFDLVTFANELKDTMIKANGLGLAANQVGVSYRIFSLRNPLSGDLMVCFNPKIVQYSSVLRPMEEGCLSYPGLYVSVKRPEVIEVEYYTADGMKHSETLTDVTARVFQHEYDHLNGEVFYNKANRFHREKALKMWKRT